MRLIDADAFRKYVLNGKPIGLTICQYSESEILHMINQQLTITSPPNDPLTLEELRKMDGEPVWVVIASGGRYAVIRFCGEIFTEFTDGMQLPNDRYGTYWRAYRRKPEEGIL